MGRGERFLILDGERASRDARAGAGSFFIQNSTFNIARRARGEEKRILDFKFWIGREHCAVQELGYSAAEICHCIDRRITTSFDQASA